MNHLSRDNHLATGNYHMSLEIVLQKEVSEGLEMFWKLFFPVSYRNHPFDGWFLINGRNVFQNGDYIFKQMVTKLNR